MSGSSERYRVRPQRTVGGELRVPGDKSISQRALMFGALTLGGLLQGLALYDPDASFKTSVEFATPFRWISGASGALVLAANITFARHFLRMLFRPSRKDEGPTLLAGPEAAEEPAP